MQHFNFTERGGKVRCEVFPFKLVTFEILFEVPMTPQFFKNLSVKWDQNPLCYHQSIILNQ